MRYWGFSSTRILRILRLAFLVAGAFISSVKATEACTCGGVGSRAACEQYQKFDVAFVGRAIDVPPDRAEGYVRFRVTHELKGVAGPEVSVLNEESGMGCGHQFEQGQDYVVFARRNAAGVIDIGPCSSTVWRIHPPGFAAPEFRRQSAEAVAFVESLLKPATGGRIFGEVWIGVPFSSPDDHDDGQKLVDGATVILQGSAERRTTSIKGGYEFTGLPRGTYGVSVIMPDGFPPARSARPPEHIGQALCSTARPTTPETSRSAMCARADMRPSWSYSPARSLARSSTAMAHLPWA